MIKILSVVVFLSSSMLALDFDEFLNNALKNSPYLKSHDLSIKQASLQGKILTRYENPSVELEYSQFDIDKISDKNGYRAAFSQPIRLWGIGSDREKLALSTEKKVQANYTLSHAQLTQDISLLFVEYAQKHELYTLAQEELDIASRIYEISQARFQAGTISQGVMLQAKVDYEMVDISLDSLKISFNERYFKLLEVAGYVNAVELNHNYVFSVKESAYLSSNPDLKLIDMSKKEALAREEVNSNSLEFIDLFGEYENELDQDIFRVGVSFPLTLFNTKKEETQVAKLEASKAEFYAKKESDKITLKTAKLNQERILLKKLKIKNETTLKTQEKLLKMFEDSYKIANVNLLELQNVKNRVIKTKESLIKIESALDANAIQTNYIAGAYNE